MKRQVRKLRKLVRLRYGWLTLIAISLLHVGDTGKAWTQSFQYNPGQTFVDGPSSINEPIGDETVSPSMIKENEMVFLLHGISKDKYDMAAMAKRLQAEGYTVVNWDYPSTQFQLKDLADKLGEQVDRFPQYKIHFVTHSMGGIVVRTYLAHHDMPNLGRVVMIGPPSQGAELAQFLGNWGLYKFFMGPAGQELKPGELGQCASAGTPGCEFGIIAGGTGRNIGINPLLPGDNDGTVTVASTQLEGAKDFALVPYPHPIIQKMPKTATLTINFLDHGNFKDTE